MSSSSNNSSRPDSSQLPGLPGASSGRPDRLAPLERPILGCSTKQEGSASASLGQPAVGPGLQVSSQLGSRSSSGQPKLEPLLPNQMGSGAAGGGRSTSAGGAAGARDGRGEAGGRGGGVNDAGVSGSRSSLPLPGASEEQAELERLRREVKQLRIENRNMYWLDDENKRLRAELEAAAHRQS